LLRHGGKGFGRGVERERMQERHRPVELRLDISAAGYRKVGLPELLGASRLSLRQP
jgi:hypothetical protein